MKNNQCFSFKKRKMCEKRVITCTCIFFYKKTVFTVLIHRLLVFYRFICMLYIYVFVVELNCYTGRGENYRGTHHRTVTGKNCVNWQNNHKFKDHHFLGQSNCVSLLIHHFVLIIITSIIIDHYLSLQISLSILVIRTPLRTCRKKCTCMEVWFFSI